MKQLSIKDEQTDFLLYTAPEGKVKVEVFLNEETVWLSQKAIATLFGVQVPAISKHLDNIYESGELTREATISILETVQIEGNREVKRNIEYYNLDAIISVGYRVNSREATQFRIWATNTLKEYIIKGSISAKQAEEKAFQEYDKFNKTQKIESDFDKVVKALQKKNSPKL